MQSGHTEIVQRRKPIGSIEKTERGERTSHREKVTAYRHQEGPERHNGDRCNIWGPEQVHIVYGTTLRELERKFSPRSRPSAFLFWSGRELRWKTKRFMPGGEVMQHRGGCRGRKQWLANRMNQRRLSCGVKNERRKIAMLRIEWR